jgi:endo-1,4-beta-xylanase
VIGTIVDGAADPLINTVRVALLVDDPLNVFLCETGRGDPLEQGRNVMKLKKPKAALGLPIWLLVPLLMGNVCTPTHFVQHVDCEDYTIDYRLTDAEPVGRGRFLYFFDVTLTSGSSIGARVSAVASTLSSKMEVVAGELFFGAIEPRGTATATTPMQILVDRPLSFDPVAIEWDVTPGPLTPLDVCADPDDCRLWEAGRIAGVRMGFATGVPAGRPRELLLAETNIALNHAFSWNRIWPERERWSFEPADTLMAFHREQGLRTMAFHFAWEQTFLDDLPAWIEKLDDPDELRALLVERAERIFERYPDLDRINVINEPLPTLGGSSEIHENYFFRVLGPDYIAELFEIVDAAAPEDVKLVLNENFVEYLPRKAEALVALVTDLVQRGIPIDSVGFQTHLMLTALFGVEPDWDVYQETMRQVADLGLDVWISELDNPVDPARPDRFAYQAENYARVVEACLSVPRCSDILIWGIQDRPAYWFPLPFDDPAPLLFDQDFDPKPAYFAVRNALLAGRPRAREIGCVSQSTHPVGWGAGHNR